MYYVIVSIYGRKSYDKEETFAIILWMCNLR